MIKWNKNGEYHQNRKRIWLDFLRSNEPFIGFEFDGPNQTVADLYDEVQRNDMVFCYQVDKRSIVGFAIVIGKAPPGNEKQIELRTDRILERPAKVHKRKKDSQILRKAHCLQHGPRQTLYKVLSKEAAELLKICT
jgi:hypothetical protein